MKKSTVALAIASLIALNVNIAEAAGNTPTPLLPLLSQDPNAPASNYDILQDHAFSAAAGLANSALNQNQQIVTQVNTVSAAVGANAQAIGQTNATVSKQQMLTQANAVAIQTTNGQVKLVSTQLQNVQGQIGQVSSQVQQNSTLLNATKSGIQQVQSQVNTLQNTVTQANLSGLAKQTDLDAEAQRATKAEGDLGQRIDGTDARLVAVGNVAGAAYSGVQIESQRITDETTRATTEEKRLDSVKVEKSDFRQRSTVVDSRMADIDNRIAQHKADQAKVNKAVADDLADHEKRINKLEQNTSANFSDLKNQVESNRRRASAAISGVAAMANIPQVTEGATFSLGAGAGTTDSESAVAVGFSARVADPVVIKASISTDSQHNFVAGAGASVQW